MWNFWNLTCTHWCQALASYVGCSLHLSHNLPSLSGRQAQIKSVWKASQIIESALIFFCVFLFIVSSSTYMLRITKFQIDASLPKYVCEGAGKGWKWSWNIVIWFVPKLCKHTNFKIYFLIIIILLLLH